MKKIYSLNTLALLCCHFVTAHAGANVTSISPTIGIKNNTNHQVYISCWAKSQGNTYYVDGTPYTLQPGEAHTFRDTNVGEGCLKNNVLQCDYKDLTTMQTGYFHIQACNSHSQNSYSSTLTTVGTEPPTPYKCNYSTSTYDDTLNGVSPVCNPDEGYVYSVYICTVEAYFAISTVGPTYTLTWENIKTNQVIGQAMATKLASILKNTGDYARPSASYSNNKITLILPPSDPNPYKNAQNISDCKDACT